jgi:hypothetical protein
MFYSYTKCFRSDRTKMFCSPLFNSEQKTILFIISEICTSEPYKYDYPIYTFQIFTVNIVINILVPMNHFTELEGKKNTYHDQKI